MLSLCPYLLSLSCPYLFARNLLTAKGLPYVPIRFPAHAHMRLRARAPLRLMNPIGTNRDIGTRLIRKEKFVPILSLLSL